MCYIGTVVKMLVERFSVDPDKADAQGRTALYLAMSAGKVDATRYLMNRTRKFNMEHLNLASVKSHSMREMLRETFASWNMKLHLPEGHQDGNSI